jgi:hypothetical protein
MNNKKHKHKFRTTVYVKFYKKIDECNYKYYKTETVTATGDTKNDAESSGIFIATQLFTSIKYKLIYELITKKIIK